MRDKWSLLSALIRIEHNNHNFLKNYFLRNFLSSSYLDSGIRRHPLWSDWKFFVFDNDVIVFQKLNAKNKKKNGSFIRFRYTSKVLNYDQTHCPI